MTGSASSVEMVFTATPVLEAIGEAHRLEIAVLEQTLEFRAPAAAVVGPTGAPGAIGPVGPIGPQGPVGPEPDLSAAAFDGGFF